MEWLMYMNSKIIEEQDKIIDLLYESSYTQQKKDIDLLKQKEEPFITVYKSKEIRGCVLELVTFNPKYVCKEE